MEKEEKGVEKEEKGVEKEEKGVEGEGRGMEMREIFQSRAYQLVAIMLHGVTVPMPSPSHMSCCPFTRGP